MELKTILYSSVGLLILGIILYGSAVFMAGKNISKMDNSNFEVDFNKGIVPMILLQYGGIASALLGIIGIIFYLVKDSKKVSKTEEEKAELYRRNY
jgi:hypothetical protein